MKSITLLLACLLVGAARADDAKDKREREAKAALAMQLELQKKPKLKEYTVAAKLAVEKGVPLISYPASVKDPVCPPKAVCAKAPPVTGTAYIAIAYPDGKNLRVSEELPTDAKPDEVTAAFDRAVKKAKEAAKEDADEPLDEWMISYEAAPPNCQCGDNCKCTGDKCLCVNEPCHGPPCLDGKCGFPNPPAVAPSLNFPQPMPSGAVERRRFFTGERFPRVRAFFSRRLF